MSEPKKIYVRLSTDDLVLTKEEAENLPSYISVVDKEGEFVTDIQTYLIGYEDEDGVECDEEGNEL
jgi:hypothetical protein